MPLNDSVHIIPEGIVDSLNHIASNSQPLIVLIKDTIINKTSGVTPIYDQVEINNIDLNISALLIIIFLGLGIGLYFLLAFLRKYILPVFVQRYKKSNIPLMWYRISVILWIVFGLLSLYVFLKSSVLITCLILSFFGLVFHQFIIDFIIGIYFRFENHIKIKDRFILNDIEGEVQSFHHRHLRVLTINNEEVLIPFRNLLQTPIRIVKHVDSSIHKHFEITLKGNTTKNLQQLETYMMMCPWVYDSKSYKIEYIENESYKISVRVKEDFTAQKIQSYIESRF